MKYILYCRKSTDESSGKQICSIPDQIKACRKYAEDKGLMLANNTPKFRQWFETPNQLKKEMELEHGEFKDVYERADQYCVIREQRSAVTPEDRPKFNKLIEFLGTTNGEYGVLCYSPDRQSRNLVDGGKMIELCKSNNIGLKFTNLEFEFNSVGVVMLSIQFALHRQYSDKLSEDVCRGLSGRVSRGLALGQRKHGYIINAQKYHEPDSESFEIVQKAFKKKIYERCSNQVIADFLYDNGYQSNAKNAVEGRISKKNMHDMRQDSFYMGIFKYGQFETVDLREANPFFQPMISEEEYQILIEMHQSKGSTLKFIDMKSKYDSIYPLPNDIVKTWAGDILYFTLPNPGRFEKKLESELKHNPHYTLEDVISPHQITYRCTDKTSDNYNFSVTYDKILYAIEDKFSQLHIDQDDGKKVIDILYKREQNKQFTVSEKVKKITFEINKKQKQYDDLVSKRLNSSYDEKELAVYNKSKALLASEISELEKQKTDTMHQQSVGLEEFESLLLVLGKVNKIYHKLANVQKSLLIKIFCSNIVVNPDLSVEIAVFPGLEVLFKDDFKSNLAI